MAETDGTTLPEELAALRSDRARLWDLVRHQRGELHVAGLITDDEWAFLIADHGAVARLEGYDEMRVELEALRKDKSRLDALESMRGTGQVWECRPNQQSMTFSLATYNGYSERAGDIRFVIDNSLCALTEVPR